MSFFAELKRRNVFRVAALYGVIAWLLIEVSDTIFPRLGLPDWTVTLVIALLILGFPVAIVLAWAFELTPDGVMRDGGDGLTQPAPRLTGARLNRLIVVGLTAVIALLVVERFWFAGRDAPEGATAAAAVTPALAGPSIAVLPFVNMSADPDNEYFADGISEELLNVLVRVEGLGVASRTSSFAFKGREVATTAIARELGVGHILEGSVRKAGNQVRITAQLIDASNDRHLWSDAYDRELTDIFAIQDEIANAIVSALRDALGTDRISGAVTLRADTENMEAYELYLRARELFIARTELVESVRLFEQVVELDPSFARGWDGLGAVGAIMGSWDHRDRDYDALALRATEHALDLDPTLSMPWAVRGLVASHRLPVDWAQVIEYSEQAIAMDGNNATAYHWRGIHWTTLGFFDRALRDQVRCLAIDPAYRNCRRWQAQAYVQIGNTDAAMELFDEMALEGDLIGRRASSFVGPLLLAGNRTAALLLMRYLEWPDEARIGVLGALERGEAVPDAASLVDRLPATERAAIFLMMGAYDLAAEVTDQDLENVVEHWEPVYSALRDSPAFRRIMERQGVPDYWRTHGFPPQCRPVGASDYRCDR